MAVPWPAQRTGNRSCHRAGKWNWSPPGPQHHQEKLTGNKLLCKWGSKRSFPAAPRHGCCSPRLCRWIIPCSLGDKLGQRGAKPEVAQQLMSPAEFLKKTTVVSVPLVVSGSELQVCTKLGQDWEAKPTGLEMAPSHCPPQPVLCFSLPTHRAPSCSPQTLTRGCRRLFLLLSQHHILLAMGTTGQTQTHAYTCPPLGAGTPPSAGDGVTEPPNSPSFASNQTARAPQATTSPFSLFFP